MSKCRSITCAQRSRHVRVPVRAAIHIYIDEGGSLLAGRLLAGYSCRTLGRVPTIFIIEQATILAPRSALILPHGVISLLSEGLGTSNIKKIL